MKHYPWQEKQWQQLVQTREVARLPHALLLQGPDGTGKHDFARVFAQALLCERTDLLGHACGQCKSCQLFASATHPDFIEISPEEEGKAIKVDQIRALINELSLSSHYGGYRIIVLSPADSMNTAAANSLLKTLEEPQANTLLILISARTSTLPATIRSRCQGVRFNLPDFGMATDWLQEALDSPTETKRLLAMANGAPLLAKQLHHDGMLAQHAQTFSDFVSLSEGKLDPMALAAKWYKSQNSRLVQWLYHWVSDMVRIKSNTAQFLYNQDLQDDLQSLSEQIDLQRLYRFLDKISEALRLEKTAVNKLLVLEGLLLTGAYLKQP